MQNQPEDLLQAYAAAVLAQDLDAFMTLYADDGLRVFDTWGVWSHDGKTAWRQVIEGWFGSLGSEQVKVSFEHVRTVVGADMALVSAFTRYSGHAASGDALRSMHNRLSWVLQRRAGTWRIVHEHTSAPVGFEDMKAILQRDAAA